jgi:hypothetical protein
MHIYSLVSAQKFVASIKKQSLLKCAEIRYIMYIYSLVCAQ